MHRLAWINVYFLFLHVWLFSGFFISVFVQYLCYA